MSAISDHLNQVVATLTTQYYQYKFFHWNYTGSDFYQNHLLFDKHAETIYKSLDIIAERIRQIGGTVEADLEYLNKESILEKHEFNAKNKLPTQEHLPQILNFLERNHDKVIAQMQETIEMAEEGDEGKGEDKPTEDMLVAFVTEQQLMRWFIVASQGKIK